MTRPTEIALTEMERRLNAIRMGGSERLVTTAAMRHSFIIVERFTSLAQALAQVVGRLFLKPALAR